MLIFDRGKFFDSLFTLIKLGVALALLYALGTKFVDMWQAEAEPAPDVSLQPVLVESRS